MNKKQIVNIIKESVDFNFIANFINATKKQLTNPNDRHFASTLRDNFFEFASYNQKVKYIDKKGADLYHLGLKTNIEIKYSTRGFLYTQKQNARKIISKIILKNTDSVVIPNIEESMSQIIICCEPNCFSILFLDDLIKNKLIDTSKPGQILAKNVPCHLFYKIMDHKEFEIIVDHYNIQEKTDNFKSKVTQEFYEKYNLALTKQKDFCKISTTPNENFNMNKSYVQQTYEFIVEHKKLDINELQTLFRNKGIEKTDKCCWGYLNSLVNSKKITKTKTKKKIKGKWFSTNIYQINEEHVEENTCQTNKEHIENNIDNKLTENHLAVNREFIRLEPQKIEEALLKISENSSISLDVRAQLVKNLMPN